VLSSLSIEGVALVDRASLEFGPGLNVLTGETGAGKSLVLGSIGLILGDRADPAWLREGAAKAAVEATFDLSGRPDLLRALHALDVETEEDRVVLRREIAPDGKSRAFVNGRSVLLSQLRAVGDLLVDLHGQHEHQTLLHADRQTDFFDSWAGLVEERRGLAEERAGILAERLRVEEARVAHERDRAEEEGLRADLAALTEAALAEGEEESLLRERDRLAHRERLLTGLGEALGHVGDDDDGAQARLKRALKALRTAAALDQGLAPLAAEGESVADAMAAFETRLEAERARLLEEPLDLDVVETRLERIHRLKRKHRTDVAGLLALRDELAVRVQALDPGSRDLEKRERALQTRHAAYDKRLERFTGRRAEQFVAFARDVGARLRRLGFGAGALRVGPIESTGTRERVAIDPIPIPSLEFAFQPNSGESARPLKRIASGGELSRVMLAIKSLMADRDQVAVLVFDEVDQGIGGSVAEEVGLLLRGLGERRQVLCITHLPLIAAYGARHFQVGKATRSGRTTTSVVPLAGDDREREIARLLAGARVTATTVRQARELLTAAAAAENGGVRRRPKAKSA
jgi:DNA repair protein RecN (Recombination protein N)